MKPKKLYKSPVCDLYFDSSYDDVTVAVKINARGAVVNRIYELLVMKTRLYRGNRLGYISDCRRVWRII
jgi:hypothetical protein